jgi:quinol monooxygenase YgiN
MSEHAGVIRITTMLVRTGHANELVQAASSVARRYSAAQGCFGAQVCEISEEPGTFAVVSRWHHREALDEFLRGDPDDALSELEAFVEAAPTTVHYSVTTD